MALPRAPVKPPWVEAPVHRTLLILLLCLCGCEDSLDAQEYEHTRDYDRYSVSVDSGSVIVRATNGRGSTRAVAQYEGGVPTVRVEVVDRVLEIEGECGERITDCWVDFFIDVQTAAPGSLDLADGTLKLEGLAGDHTADLLDGTFTGEELTMGLLIVDASGGVDAEWTGFPSQVDLQSTAGDIALTVPTGDYALDLTASGEVSVEGVTDDPASDKSLRATADAGAVTVTGR
jgi:DUF4097 and DUF4098 domain-containing protein YvlB